MIENNKQTDISNLGEFGLIKHLTEKVTLVNSSTLKGIGDDAAVIDPSDKKILVSTDLLIENVHFDLVYTPLKHLGYKAAVVNISDIAAMNGIPKQLTISIAISSKFSIEAIEEIYKGILLACKVYNVDLIGGDTSASTTGLMISGTVIGEAEEKEITYRNTAKENDLICVTGDLGGAYMGLQLLEREKSVFKADPNMQPELTGFDYILEKQLKPEARTDIYNILKDLKIIPTSMIDISDGLASEIMHICDQSDTGCVIYENKLPIDQLTYDTAMEFSLDPTMCALNGGEDYELLFTVNQKDYEKLKQNMDITIVGHITDKNAGYHLVTKNEVMVPLKAQGWNAFDGE